MRTNKLRKVFVFVLGFLFTSLFFGLRVSADDGSEECCSCCSKNCGLCSWLCKNGKCYCYLVYVALAIILVTLIACGVVLIFKYKERQDDKNEENKVYQENYAKIMAEKKRRDKLQEEYDRKVNQEDGYEDLLIQMVKSNDKDAREVLLDFLDEKNINPEDVTLEFSVSKSKKRDEKHDEGKR